MFIETRSGFAPLTELPVTVAPARIGKYHELAEAMRRGERIVRPSSSYGSADPTEGCALCCLAVGLGEPVGAALYHVYKFNRFGETWVKLSDKYGQDLMLEIEERFEGMGSFEPHSFTEIADWLDSLDSQSL